MKLDSETNVQKRTKTLVPTADANSNKTEAMKILYKNQQIARQRG